MCISIRSEVFLPKLSPLLLLLALLRLVQTEKRSFGLPQAGRLTTVTAGTTGQLRVGVIQINRVGIAVRFVGVGEELGLQKLFVLG